MDESKLREGNLLRIGCLSVGYIPDLRNPEIKFSGPLIRLSQRFLEELEIGPWVQMCIDLQRPSPSSFSTPFARQLPSGESKPHPVAVGDEVLKTLCCSHCTIVIPPY